MAEERLKLGETEFYDDMESTIEVKIAVLSMYTSHILYCLETDQLNVNNYVNCINLCIQIIGEGDKFKSIKGIMTMKTNALAIFNRFLL